VSLDWAISRVEIAMNAHTRTATRRLELSRFPQRRLSSQITERPLATP